jgi:redox-sensing transcriptional repressor
MKVERVSELTINRLSVYLRCLDEMRAEGRLTASSQSLAERCNFNPAQIRKDLAYFGEFGVRGLGYNIDDLRRHLRSILGLNTPHRIGIIGAGNLGTALANYEGFSPDSFTVVGLFDNDPAKIGKRLPGGLCIYSISEFARVAAEQQIDIVAIAVPASAAEAVLETILLAGIKAILNFAPVRLQAPTGVKIKHVDLMVSLESLSYFLAGAARCVESQERRDRA